MKVFLFDGCFCTDELSFTFLLNQNKKRVWVFDEAVVHSLVSKQNQRFELILKKENKVQILVKEICLKSSFEKVGIQVVNLKSSLSAGILSSLPLFSKAHVLCTGIYFITLPWTNCWRCVNWDWLLHLGNNHLPILGFRVINSLTFTYTIQLNG